MATRSKGKQKVGAKQAVFMAVGVMVILLVLPLTILLENHQNNMITHASGDTFVTHQGADLYLNGQKMRFAGSNMYWLGLSEDGGVHYPTHTEIDAAMTDAQSMGANVVRTMSAMPVGCPLCIEPSLNSFNDGTNGKTNAFEALDYAISSAKKHNIKLVMPLVDYNCYFMGCVKTYLQWRGITPDAVSSQFFTDTTVRQDFKNHIAAVLNHVNQYTGNAYKDESAIMMWETGNELASWPNSWTYQPWENDISTFIKATDTHHLVGSGQFPPSGGPDVASLQLPNVDVYTTHSYDNWRSPQDVITESNLVHSYGKVFFLGEFTSTGKSVDGSSLSWTLPQMLSAIEQNNINGDLFWELLPNSAQHGDGFTLHYPGDTPDMQTRAQAFKNHAFVMCPANGSCRNAGVLAATPTSAPIPTPTAVPTTKPQPTPTTVPAASLKNNSFENAGSSLSPWLFQVNSPAAATVSKSTDHVDGNYSALVTITKSNANAWYVSLYQGNISLSGNRTYSITFWAKASNNRQVAVFVQQNYAPYKHYLTQSINLTTAWKQYTMTYVQPQIETNASLQFSLAQTTGKVWVDNVSLR